MPIGKSLLKAAWEWGQEKLIARWPAIVAWLGAAAMTWLASISRWTIEYGPVMWGAIGIASALVIALIVFLVSQALRAFSEARYKDLLTLTPVTVNPLLPTFNNQKIRLAEFYSHNSLYQRKSFNGCHIYGPGALAILNGCSFNGFGLIHCDLVLVRNAPIVAAVGFEDTTFFDCEFVNLTLYLPELAVKKIEEDLRRHGRPMPIIVGYNEPTITGPTPQSAPGSTPTPPGQIP